MYFYKNHLEMDSTLQLSKSEIDMMKEVSQVFSKYSGKTRQFELQLVHSHFAIENDEILYETHDAKTRTLISTPIKKSASIEALATCWEINKAGEIEVTGMCCTIGPPPPPSKASL
jgi:hypothetical protein